MTIVFSFIDGAWSHYLGGLGVLVALGAKGSLYTIIQNLDIATLTAWTWMAMYLLISLERMHNTYFGSYLRVSINLTACNSLLSIAFPHHNNQAAAPSMRAMISAFQSK